MGSKKRLPQVNWLGWSLVDKGRLRRLSDLTGRNVSEA